MALPSKCESKKTYRGRFAPSPTGPLHFGSLVAATASYLDAKSRGGEWIVRMEDLDTERVQPGAADRMLADLEHFGFEWDGPVLLQSQRNDSCREAFQQLQSAGLVYPCACSRKDITVSASPSADANGARYPGTCSGGIPAGKKPRSWRVRVGNERICFEDRLQGLPCQNLAQSIGDFVVLRADGPFAYQFAVVVDDAAQGIADVVRGADLLDSTPRQIYLLQLLGVPTPRYLHIPLVTDIHGRKLSKQNRALALNHENAGAQLYAAIRFLGQDPPASLQRASVGEIWRWVINRDRSPGNSWASLHS